MRSIPSLAATLALAGSLSLTPAPLAAQESAESERLARHLLDLTRAGELGLQVMTQMIDTLASSNPQVPAAFWDEFLAEIDPEGFVELSVPIYVEHLTVEEMEAAIAFYSTPEGQAILTKMPTIVQQAMQAGQAWGMEVGQRAMERLAAWKQAHPEL